MSELIFSVYDHDGNLHTLNLNGRIKQVSFQREIIKVVDTISLLNDDTLRDFVDAANPVLIAEGVRDFQLIKHENQATKIVTLDIHNCLRLIIHGKSHAILENVSKILSVKDLFVSTFDGQILKWGNDDSRSNWKNIQLGGIQPIDIVKIGLSLLVLDQDLILHRVCESMCFNYYHRFTGIGGLPFTTDQLKNLPLEHLPTNHRIQRLDMLGFIRKFYLGDHFMIRLLNNGEVWVSGSLTIKYSREDRKIELPEGTVIIDFLVLRGVFILSSAQGTLWQGKYETIQVESYVRYHFHPPKLITTEGSYYLSRQHRNCSVKSARS